MLSTDTVKARRQVSETSTGSGGGNDDHRRSVARDHDGYSYAEHFVGDACPGGHLDTVGPDRDFQDPWSDGRLGDRRDNYHKPCQWLDNEERFIKEVRGDEAFWEERLVRGTGPIHVNRTARRKWERRLQDAEESWDSLDPYYDGTFE
jgi:hypothetical protein